MENNKRDRAALKSYFKTNAVPTQGNFEDFIDGTLNLREDGIAKPSGSALAIEAAGAAGSQKNVLQLYEAFADTDPAWVLSLRPINASSVQKQGLSISDKVGGVSRFFIDRTSGNVGVGTIEPAARLHVAGDLRVDGALQVGSIVPNAGLKIPAGQPVSGVQVIEMLPLNLASTSNFKSKIMTGAVTFSQPVVKASVFLQGWYLNYSDPKEVIRYIGVRPSCTAEGNIVNVTVTCTLQTNAPNKDWDAFSANVDMIVVAVLQNAV